MALPTPRSPQPESFTRPDNPRLAPSQAVTVGDLRQVFSEILEHVKANDSKAMPEAAKSAADKKPQDGEPQEKTLLGRGSRQEYIVVNEIWDQNYGYKIEESKPVDNSIAELDQYAFVVRKQFDKLNTDFTPFLDIKSEPLRDALRALLKDVPGLSLQEDMPKIEPKALFHHVSSMKSFCQDHAAVEHGNLLLEFMRDHFGPTVQRLRPLHTQGEITFDLLWTLFRPNDLVYAGCSGSGSSRCVKFVVGEECTDIFGVKSFRMQCCYTNYDGKRVGQATVNLVIPYFSVARKVDTLEAFPLRFHEDGEAVRETLIGRGRIFVSLQGIHHRHYRGQAFYGREDEPIKCHVDGRVIVDATSFRQENPNYLVPMERSRSKGELILWDSFDWPSATQPTLDKYIPAENVQEDDLLIASPTVLGYSLRDQIWLEFAVAGLKEITWDPECFDRLALDPQKKSIVRGAVQSHDSNRGFDDFIRGKGKGTILLFHGPPGVGKTLAAEGISEDLQRPLYRICAGELGDDPQKLEHNLGRILRRASHWKAVLLLDEADVFLEKRSSGMHTNNALVSIFLRTLEYYEGVMILTTNRIEAFDPAMISRIHIPLRFRELGPDPRKKVWRSFLEKAEALHNVAALEDREMQALVNKKLNGRQIKNIVGIALASARDQGIQLTYSGLEAVSTLMDDFGVDFQGYGAAENQNSYA